MPLLLAFAGFVLERIHGRNSDKRIGQPTFHDITYVRQLLFSTFKSLHMAQRQLAFHHADLRLANIMEVDPSFTPPSSAAGSRRSTSSSSTTPTNSDPPDSNAHHAKSDSAQEATPAVPQLSSQTQLSSDPSIITGVSAEPQLPNHWSLEDQSQIIHHFKIIDYGLADFKELFGAGYVRSNNGHRHKRKQSLYRGSSLGKMAVPVTDAQDAGEGEGCEEGYMRAARPVGCVAFLPHPSKLLPQVLHARLHSCAYLHFMLKVPLVNNCCCKSITAWSAGIASGYLVKILRSPLQCLRIEVSICHLHHDDSTS